MVVPASHVRPVEMAETREMDRASSEGIVSIDEDDGPTLESVDTAPIVQEAVTLPAVDIDSTDGTDADDTDGTDADDTDGIDTDDADGPEAVGGSPLPAPAISPLLKAVSPLAGKPSGSSVNGEPGSWTRTIRNLIGGRARMDDLGLPPEPLLELVSRVVSDLGFHALPVSIIRSVSTCSGLARFRTKDDDDRSLAVQVEVVGGPLRTCLFLSFYGPDRATPVSLRRQVLGELSFRLCVDPSNIVTVNPADSEGGVGNRTRPRAAIDRKGCPLPV